jgi:hypothetical protein
MLHRLPRERDDLVDGGECSIDARRRAKARFSFVCHQSQAAGEEYGNRACGLSTADVMAELVEVVDDLIGGACVHSLIYRADRRFGMNLDWGHLPPPIPTKVEFTSPRVVSD